MLPFLFLLLLFLLQAPLAISQEAPTPYWVEKTAQALRGGEGLGPDEDLEAYLAMSKEQVVDLMLADARFGITALRFAQYFLQRASSRQNPAITNLSRTNEPQAMAAAVAAANDGDFFQLFDARVPLLVLALMPPYLDVGSPGDPLGTTTLPDIPPARRKALRLKHKEQMLRRLGEIESLFRLALHRPELYGEACFAFNQQRDFIRSKLQAYGVENLLIQKISGAWFPWLDVSTGEDNRLRCAERDFTKGLMQSRILREEWPAFMQFLENMPERGLNAPTMKDLVPFTFAGTRLSDLRTVEAWSNEAFWGRLVNSSTNFNRKRASYVLRTYLCDDLVPVQLPEDGNHNGQGRHASDPGCQSCHYKLDPMAGLFRYRGAGGENYKTKDTFYFDDFTALKGVAKKWLKCLLKN